MVCSDFFFSQTTIQAKMTTASPLLRNNMMARSNGEGLDRQELLSAGLQPYDIICGRGAIAFNNVGNRRFRVLMGLHLDRYEAAVGRNQKGMVIASVVQILTDDIGARFFKTKKGQLVLLSEAQIRQKIGHALRDMLVYKDKSHRQQEIIETSHKLELDNENEKIEMLYFTSVH
jgi:hypothetical protein